MSAATSLVLNYTFTTHLTVCNKVHNAVYGAFEDCQEMPVASLGTTVHRQASCEGVANTHFVTSAVNTNAWDDFIGFRFIAAEMWLRIVVGIARPRLSTNATRTNWRLNRRASLATIDNTYARNGGLGNILCGYMNAHMLFTILQTRGIQTAAYIQGLGPNGDQHFELFPNRPPLQWLVALAVEHYGCQAWEISHSLFRTLAERYRASSFDSFVPELERLAGDRGSSLQLLPPARPLRLVAVKKSVSGNTD